MDIRKLKLFEKHELERLRMIQECRHCGQPIHYCSDCEKYEIRPIYNKDAPYSEHIRDKIYYLTMSMLGFCSEICHRRFN